MFQIRTNIWETNSSSTHAIVVPKCDKNLAILSELTMHPGEFYRESERYDTPDGRASYLYTAILCKYRDYNTNRLTKEGNRIINWIFDVLGKNGCKCTFEEITVSEYGLVDYGIDHSEDLSDWLRTTLKNEKYLLRYLFSDLSFIQTGSDEDSSRDLVDAAMQTPGCDTYNKEN